VDLRKKVASPLVSHYSIRSDANTATRAIGHSSVLLTKQAGNSTMQQFSIQSIISLSVCHPVSQYFSHNQWLS